MDPWTIPVEMRAKYDAQFEIIQQNGAVTGDVARALFLKSGLPAQVLAKIWALADMDADGRIDKKEFSIALWLIAMKLKGIEVPDRLPASMLAPPPRPPPSVPDSFAATGMAPPRPGPPAVPAGMAGPPPIPPAPTASAMAAAPPPPPPPLPSGVVPQASVRAGGPPPKPPPPMNVPPPKPAPPAIPPAPQAMVASVPVVASVAQSTEWAVPQATKLKYTQLFNQHDRQRTGFLSGNQARGILTQTGLPNAVLAQIWQLSDIDSDGRLTCEELVLAMHLCEQVRAGQQLAPTLPADLIPPSYRRRPSASARRDSIGSVGSAGSRGHAQDTAATLVSPSMSHESMDLIGGLPMGHATFEDKRRENFEKGQAELERRRQIILEQQKREQQERERKEREELQRREKLRLEQERKRQEELEAERERQRQRAEELEAERKRMQEQKEAARKEMERQRELEMQRQRIAEMTALKQRTQEGLSLLKRRKLDLCLQVEKLSREVGEVNGKMAAQREEVATAKALIDGMRPQRDQIMAELSAVKAQFKECSDQTLLLNQEKLNMQNQLASLKSKAGNKKRELETKIEMARKQLQQLNNEIKNKTAEVEAAEKEVEDKENAKNAANNVDESVWGAAPVSKDEMPAEDSAKQQRDDPTNVDWGDEAPKAGPIIPPPPTQATMDAWCVSGDTSAPAADDAWPASDTNTGWATADRVSASATEVSAASREATTGGGAGTTKYRALYEFEARNEDELCFQPGDIINVTVGEQGEPGWLAGELRGKTGWFPESYVEPVDGAKAVDGPAPAEAEVRSTPLDTVHEEPGAVEGEALYYAVYPYDSDEPGDLCFPLGASIKVTHRDGDWWTGIYNGVSGIFPHNYVSTEKPVEGEHEVADTAAEVSGTAAVIADGKQPESTNEKRPTTHNDTKKSMKKKPEIVVVVANYEASGDGQLSLVKGQFVQVRKKTDGGWWEGEIHQKGKPRTSGWFPASYVKVLAVAGSGSNTATTGAAAPAAPAAPSSSSSSNNTTANNRSTPAGVTETAAVPAASSATVQQTASAKTAEGEKVKAIFEFKGQHDDELTFAIDEIIVVTNKDDTAWWKGFKVCDGPSMEGLFPSSYVEAITGGDAVIENGFYHPVNYGHFYENSILGSKLVDNVSDGTFSAGKHPQTTREDAGVASERYSPGIGPPIGKASQSVQENAYQEIDAVSSYYANTAGDIYTRADTEPTRRSLVHASSSPDNIYWDIESLDQQDVANNNELSSITNKMTSLCHQEQNHPQHQQQHGATLSSPHQQKQSVSNSRVSANSSTAEGGYLLSRSELPDSPVKERPSSLDMKPFSRSLSSQRFSPAKLSHVNYEDILDEIHQNEQLDAKEKERQSAIYELISTEQAYVKDLMLVEKYFARPMKKSGRVSAEDASRMMANWRELITCSDKILKALKIRQMMSADHVIITIGDIIVENMTHLLPYVRFCSRQSQAMQLIQQRTEQDPWFGEICKQFSRNPIVNGMPLTSYLLKPMQRITKYPLLVDKILKCTSSRHPDHAQLVEASRRMAQLCSQINEAVRMVENTERLEWCQNHLLPSQAGSVASPIGGPPSVSSTAAIGASSQHRRTPTPRIVFNSFTNTLGPRKLLYHGPLVKTKSGKELVGFLFNDFLLLTQPLNKDVAKVGNIFTDDRALKSQYRFYKEPFFIETLRLDDATTAESPSGDGAFIIHTETTNDLGQPEKYELNVRAGGTRERTGWLSKIRQAVANYEAIDRKNRQSSLSELQLGQSGCGRLLVVVQCAKQLCRVSAESQDTFCSLSLGGQTHTTPLFPASANPAWNSTMQFVVKDPQQDVLCVTVLQKQKFSPNEFLGRTEVRVSEVHERRQNHLGAISFSDLKLLEVPSGTVSLRVDLQLFREASQII